MPEDAAPRSTGGDTGAADELLAQRSGPVLTLTINRPERRNAMTWSVIAAIREQLARARTDGSVRVVVLTGCGA